MKAYNSAATSLNPPHPTVDWSKVSHCSFLKEFDFFLHDPRGEINTKPWSQPVIRVVMKQAWRVAHAQMEIVHCNVEVRCLHTAIVDEEWHFVLVLNGLKASGEKIYHAIQNYCTLRHCVNSQLLVRIAHIYELKGFTGIPFPGVRKGMIPVDSSPSTVPEMQEEDNTFTLHIAGNDDDDLASEIE